MNALRRLSHLDGEIFRSYKYFFFNLETGKDALLFKTKNRNEQPNHVLVWEVYIWVYKCLVKLFSHISIFLTCLKLM